MKKSLVFVMIVVFASICLFSACEDKNDGGLKKYNVTLVYEANKTANKVVTFDDIENAYAERTDTSWFPTKNNYRFDGWYYDSEYSNQFYYNIAPEGDSFTLYAKWTTFKATFVYSNGSDVIYENVMQVEIPPEPERSDLRFLGWKYQSAIVEFPFELTEDSIFYQEYDQEEAYILNLINFDIESELVGGNRYYYEGESVEIMTVPTSQDYFFVGWFEGETRDRLLSTDLTYTFTMPDKNYTIMAYYERYCIVNITFIFPNGESHNETLRIVKNQSTTLKVPDALAHLYDGYTPKWHADDIYIIGSGLSFDYIILRDTEIVVKID